MHKVYILLSLSLSVSISPPVTLSPGLSLSLSLSIFFHSYLYLSYSDNKKLSSLLTMENNVLRNYCIPFIEEGFFEVTSK